MSAPTKPNLLQYIGYCYGRRLPDSMRDWVRNDLAGKGATVRMMVRVFIPAFLIMIPFWFIPTTLDVHLSMTLPILLPFVLFSHALNKVWRRHMLRKHGLDPNLADEHLATEERPHSRGVHRALRPAVRTVQLARRLSPAQVAEFVERLRPAHQPVGGVDQLVAVALLRHRRARHRAGVGR